ncbi:MAG: choline transporter, partial [Pseudomonadales bacterium]|nr:choline transporter [Pseudomonadales bacterium]
LPSLQTAAIASALPFSFALLAAIWGFSRALKDDSIKREAMLFHTASAPDVPWEERLNNLFQYPALAGVKQFQSATVKPVMEKFSQQLERNGVETTLDEDLEEGRITLRVSHGGELDFVYTVFANRHNLPHEAILGHHNSEDIDEGYWRAEVHLREGGQDYDVMGWTRSQLANDLLEQYEKHLHYLHVLR